ncbi:protein MTSS 2 isoform X2 [Acyrthosiphon pisum]|uniref:IMD domain-containing protein n=1 Tax=Acyrthosiphon pisum TaxID=7029 RepID=A0A8R1W4Q1_ACYPI|nr:protein MTSS 2 isoform X2 [Acyrthosiphon pisum]|eukprot:XP_003242498.1 PREDICTED: MTSS1-like protein isoform X2 [Acyrthosiphon pisum]
MEGNGVGKDCNALGGLFQQIVMDLKNGTPMWEDFMAKATKLHTCLRATIHAIGAYLDAFQKIADAATNARGATKEIGTALTRMCLRHRAVEARMKTFSSAIMDCLVVPLQEKLEDWKKTIVNLDKEHAKEYKKARAELKKRSTDTLRLQKKARKGAKMNELHKALQDVSDRKAVLEETEKRAVREALIEERSRYCIFVTILKPVLEEEVAMLMELSHLQEVMDKLEAHTTEPYSLPPASEQVLVDYKGSEMSWTHQTPPSSPSSLGSRKSSMCSINSINSWSSGSTHSPSHQYWSRSLLQPVSNELRYKGPLPPSRLCSASSRDSGFTSQDAIYTKQQSYSKAPNSSDSNSSSAGSSTPSTPFASSEGGCGTWPNAQETLQFERAASAIMNDARPHTISGGAHHQRPALSAYTFQPDSSSIDKTPVVSPQDDYAHVPDVPSRDMHKSYNPTSLKTIEYIQPTYVNMHELASMAANKAQERNSQHNEPSSIVNLKSDGDRKESTSESSLESSSGYSSQTAISNATPDEGYSSLKSGTLCRRSSIQSNKPPPPIRRTPSILNNSVQNLPPPPPFLLDITAEQRQQSRSQTSLTSEKVYSEPMTHQRKSSGGNVAETVRNLTQLNHTPASPILLRRTPSNRSTSADRCNSRSSEPVTGFMAALGSRLLQQQPKTTGGSPKLSRRWIAPARHSIVDPATCHDSLMEQIRKGMVLRKSIAVNDRSAPKTN